MSDIDVSRLWDHCPRWCTVAEHEGRHGDEGEQQIPHYRVIGGLHHGARVTVHQENRHGRPRPEKWSPDDDRPSVLVHLSTPEVDEDGVGTASLRAEEARSLARVLVEAADTLEVYHRG